LLECQRLHKAIVSCELPDSAAAIQAEMTMQIIRQNNILFAMNLPTCCQT